MKYYTGAGDKGKTTITGKTGVAKDSPRVEAYGNLDELEAILGIAISHADGHKDVVSILKKMQNLLHVASAELADPKGKRGMRIAKEHLKWLEDVCDSYGAKTRPLSTFVLLGGSPAGARLHFARTVARRAERSLVALWRKERVSKEMLAFINRLSSALFVLARYVNERDGYKEESPSY
ncbi:MAG: cob(I)yrinic acid a,c-diamide adenosyltransferase [Candidatus Aenigmatarchaeota archaeon]|nr:MAG: cob(I)yrinic acid a,c-diamide adenosyltransferase [Candidatus Aenigmarchaeota archaeon]